MDQRSLDELSRQMEAINDELERDLAELKRFKSALLMRQDISLEMKETLLQEQVAPVMEKVRERTKELAGLAAKAFGKGGSDGKDPK
jgi:hypothetical protein